MLFLASNDQNYSSSDANQLAKNSPSKISYSPHPVTLFGKLCYGHLIYTKLKYILLKLKMGELVFLNVNNPFIC